MATMNTVELEPEVKVEETQSESNLLLLMRTDTGQPDESQINRRMVLA